MSKIKLGSVLKIKHGYAFKTENYVPKSRFRLVTLGNFEEGNNSFKYNDTKATYYEGFFPEEVILQPMDLIMPLTEQVIGLFGNSAFIPESEDYTFVLNQRVGKVVVNEKKLDKIYAHYLLATENVKKQLEHRATGTRQRNISPNDVYDVSVILPSVNEQKRIGMLLYSIEEKQKLNNKIISELESMAKTLYDYWFLQFDFPGDNGKPYKSSGGKMVYNEELKREIPEGWEVVELGHIFAFNKGRIPDNIVNKFDECYSSPYITIDVANGGIPLYCSPKNMVECKGETIMVMDGAASGDIYLGNYGSLGSTFSKLTSLKDDVSNSLIYCILKANSFVYKKANTGSTVPHANKHFIESMKLPIPKSCMFFSYQLDKLYSKIHNCRCENRDLASLRDFLLPMLMNGQVTFKDAAEAHND